MQILIVGMTILALSIGLAIVWIRGRASRTNLPTQVVVTSGNQEVMSVRVLEDVDTTMKQLCGKTQLPPQIMFGSLKSLLEPLLQVAPAVGTAAMAHSSKLMEVVINGQMLAASDGNGLRAIAKAGKGFEHARMYEPSTLQNVANAAAMWQIVSVVVAQKHLADISATLKRVESKVEGIQSFLEEARLAVIRSATNYLEVAGKAVENGEFLDRTRGELERFDIELDRARIALASQIERESENNLERDAVGCEGEYKSALNKQKRLSHLVDELTICNEVRLANWYLCSIYPDNSKILAPRLDQIRESVNEAKFLKIRLSYSVEADCVFHGHSATDSTVILPPSP